MTRLAYLFPGQGSQRIGMGKLFYDQFSAAREVFDEADGLVGLSLRQLCFEGPAEELIDTSNAQPAILTVSIAMWRAARQAGAPAPDWVAGHSLGHFSSLVAAGALSFADGLKLVTQRGKAMKAAGVERPGGMAAVLRLDRDTLERVCWQASEETGQHVGLANDNSPDQIVISGAGPALERAIQLAKEAGAKRIVPLPVSVAAHSPFMEGAAAALREAVAGVTIHAPQFPVISNVTARPLSGPDEVRADIVEQLTRPVRWTETITGLNACEAFVEVGPGAVLTGLAKRIFPDRPAWSLDEEGGLERLIHLTVSECTTPVGGRDV